MTVATKTKYDIKLCIGSGDKYSLIFLSDGNSDADIVEFVINLLTKEFSYTPDDAYEVALTLDEDGKVVVAQNLSQVEAIAKRQTCINEAKKNGFNQFDVLIQKE